MEALEIGEAILEVADGSREVDGVVRDDELSVLVLRRGVVIGYLALEE